MDKYLSLILTFLMLSSCVSKRSFSETNRNNGTPSNGQTILEPIQGMTELREDEKFVLQYTPKGERKGVYTYVLNNTHVLNKSGKCTIYVVGLQAATRSEGGAPVIRKATFEPLPTEQLKNDCSKSTTFNTASSVAVVTGNEAKGIPFDEDGQEIVLLSNVKITSAKTDDTDGAMVEIEITRPCGVEQGLVTYFRETKTVKEKSTLLVAAFGLKQKTPKKSSECQESTDKIILRGVSGPTQKEQYELVSLTAAKPAEKK